MDRLSSIVEGLVRMVWGKREYGFFTVLVVATICERIGRATRELKILMAMFRAGTLWTRRSPATGLTRRKPTPPVTSALPDPMKLVMVALPRQFRWLVKEMGEAILSANELERLLEDSEMQALLAASPRAVRAVRSLCWMLGIAIPKPPAPIPPVPPGPSTAPERERAPGETSAAPFAEVPRQAGSRGMFQRVRDGAAENCGLERSGLRTP